MIDEIFHSIITRYLYKMSFYKKEISMKCYMEIRASEGGDDAKLLTSELARIYLKYAEKHQVKSELLTHLDSL
jgi:protein subunit release factor A